MRQYATAFTFTPGDLDRWRDKLAAPDLNGCRLWTASTDPGGYGQLTITVPGGKRRTVKAHLFAWLAEVGPFPPGLEPDHTCEREHCTTVGHLEWVTQAENIRRMGLRRTHCRAGLHRWDEQDPVINVAGHRECRPCRNEGKRDRYALTSRR